MFKIRKILDIVSSENAMAIAQVDGLFRAHFGASSPGTIQRIAEDLHNPFEVRFRTVLFVAEREKGKVVGFAIVCHEPILQFSYLDYIVGQHSSGGVGSALYEQARDEAAAVGSKGLFFECPPDESSQAADGRTHAENVARLRFYERYGARPIVGTAYETPVPGGSSEGLPHLVFDGLDRADAPQAPFVQAVMRAILERKYGAVCPPEYVDAVVDSVREDPVSLRPWRYRKPQRAIKPNHWLPQERVVLAVSDRHDIHHIRERGYVESPVRIKALQEALGASGLFETAVVREQPLEAITDVHDPDLVAYLQRVCENTPPGTSVYPYVFPIRNAARPPRELSVRAGYYCIDTFTPIHHNAFVAARRGVDCALAGADAVLGGRRAAYALVRPPGHHAERRTFGGFCYLNSAAVAAHRLSRHGRVAIVDVDYHHGNGQQDIFYSRRDVLTVSLHGDPDFAYPYFTGFADECGEGDGLGYNKNYPLPEQLGGEQYRQSLRHAIGLVSDFSPEFLVICLGLDTAKGDPTGTWSLTPADFEENGKLLGSLRKPSLVVQEGGYRTRTLGVNAVRFFTGLVKALHGR